MDLPESLPKLEREREWNDYGISELVSKYIDGGKKWYSYIYIYTLK